MLLHIREKISLATRSSAGYDEHRNREFWLSGPLQQGSGALIFILFIALFLVQFVIDNTIALGCVATIGAFAITGIVLFAWIRPEVEKHCPLEAERWIYSHIILYGIIVMLTLLDLWLLS